MFADFRTRCKQPLRLTQETSLIAGMILVIRASGETARIRERLPYQEGVCNALPLPTFVPDLRSIDRRRLAGQSLTWALDTNSDHDS